MYAVLMGLMGGIVPGAPPVDAHQLLFENCSAVPLLPVCFDDPSCNDEDKLRLLSQRFQAR